ncbi:MAG: glycosyltransferase family 4 protein [Vicingaceae bacterium]
MSVIDSSKSPSYILMLPSWYPNHVDKADGNFIEKHIETIAEDKKVVVLFVKGIKKFEGNPSERFTHGNYHCVKRYFRSYPGILGKVINFWNFMKTLNNEFIAIREQHGLPSTAHIHVVGRSSLLAVRLKRKYGIPFMVSEHWGGYYVESGKMVSTKRLFNRYILKQAKALTAVSESLSTAMKLLVPSADIQIVPNVVADVFFEKQIKIDKGSEINLIHVSNMVPVKRLDAIIRSVNILASEHANLNLVIVGDGPSRAKMEQLALEQPNLKNRVSFKGDVSQDAIATLLQESTASVLFSKYETQSLALMESIAMGVPVVAPAVGGIPEYFHDKGILFSGTNEKDLLEALQTFLKKRNTFDSQSLRNYAIEHFSSDRIKSQFYRLYDSLIPHVQ